MNQLTNHPKLVQFFGLLVVFALLCFFIAPSDSNVLWRFPSLIAGLPYLINDSVEYLMFDWWPIQVYDPDIEEFEEKTVSATTNESHLGEHSFCNWVNSRNYYGWG